MQAQKAPSGDIHYQSRRLQDSRTSEFVYRLKTNTHRAQVGSLEFFLAERYLLFSGSDRGRLSTGRVVHDPYPLCRVYGWFYHRGRFDLMKLQLQQAWSPV